MNPSDFPTTSEKVLEILRESGAIMKGHFSLSSGRHSDVYFEKFRALERPPVAVMLGEALAERFRDLGVDVVLAPAVGGVILGFTTALALGARSIFSEREAGEMKLRRGFSIEPGEHVLVVEDIITTGRSAREVVALVPPEQLVGVGCLLDRSGGTSGLDVFPLAALDAESWGPEDCPNCARGEDLESPGSRHIAAG